MLPTINIPQSAPSARALNSFRSSSMEDEFLGLKTDIDRFAALRLIKTLGRDYGFTPSMVQLLEYYMVRTQDIDWEAGNVPICYQAVNATARELGISERQVNYLETSLFELGVIRWEDSGNHKRYGVRDRHDGTILYAFGIDLSPLADLLPDLELALEYKKSSKKQWEEKRRSISSMRSHIRALVTELIQHEEHHEALQSCMTTYEAISYRIRSHHIIDDLLALEEEHISIIDLLNNLYEDMYKDHVTQKSSAMDAIYFRHIQDTNNLNSSKEDTSSKKERSSSTNNKDFQKLKMAGFEGNALNSANVSTKPLEKAEDLPPPPKIDNITWKQVLNASSDRYKNHIPMHDRALSWNDLVEAAHSLLPELGIHKTAWWNACEVMGRNGAAICVMIIDQKLQTGEVKNGGGYLREMTRRAQNGELNLLASVFGLLKRGEHENAC